MASQNNYDSNIKDHWSQINITNIIIVKKFELLRDKVSESRKNVGKMALTDLLNAVLPQIFNLYKMQPQRSTVKRGLPVRCFRNCFCLLTKSQTPYLHSTHAINF